MCIRDRVNVYLRNPPMYSMAVWEESALEHFYVTFVKAKSTQCKRLHTSPQEIGEKSSIFDEIR